MVDANVDLSLAHYFFRLVDRLQNRKRGGTDPASDVAAGSGQGRAAEGQAHSEKREEEEEKQDEEKKEQDLGTQVRDHDYYSLFNGHNSIKVTIYIIQILRDSYSDLKLLTKVCNRCK